MFHLCLGLFNYTRALEHLNIDRNPLLPFSLETFAGLESTLRNLSCQSCSLTSVSLPAISRLINLERLKLQSNLLAEIKPDHLLSSMTKLIAVDLQRNQLTDIPPLFPSLLRELELGNNQLTRLPLNNQTLGELAQLVTLDLSSNPLHCDCQMKPVYHWLLTHFQSELVPYVQWICSAPKQLAGKKLGALKETDFVCDETLLTTVKPAEMTSE